MMIIVNNFSLFVFGDIFPNPTLVKLLNVKYRAVTYFVLTSGPLNGSLSLYGIRVSLARIDNHPSILSSGFSKLPIKYHRQASQWAIKAKPNIKRKSKAMPYSEYRSAFLATLTNRKRRAVFNKPIRVVVYGKKIAYRFWILQLTNLYSLKTSSTNNFVTKAVNWRACVHNIIFN